MSIRIIRPAQLAKELSVSSVTLWRMEKRGELPPRVQLTGKAYGWLESDIEEWQNERLVDKSVKGAVK